ncbi:MAG: hypothetical protein AAGK78_02630 [Planctomycetota bacterium]
MRNALVVVLGLALAGFQLVGCNTPEAAPVLGELYNKAAQSESPQRRPVVVLPGILGSKLVAPDDTVVWGAFTGDFARPDTPEGGRLVSLPMETGKPLGELRDEVRADGALEQVRVNLLGLRITNQAYYEILGTLGAGGYRDQGLGNSGAIDYGDAHFTCFQFGYDWRRSNVETARELYRYLLKQRKYIADEMAKLHGDAAPREDEVKFDIVAHSMGGLVTRYMLRYGDQPLPEDGSMPELTWAGAGLVERVIIVGTPNAGSIESLVQLQEGKKFAPILLPRAPASVLGSMPSIYQLLPRPRHAPVTENGVALDLYDPQVWIDRNWGLANPEHDDELEDLLPDVESAEARRAIALDHLRKSLAEAEQFAAALDLPAKLPGNLELHLFCGDAEPTNRSAEWNGKELKMVDSGPGDGTVLRSSALLDERVGGEWTPTLQTPIDWTGYNFLFQNHLGITRSPEFSDKVLFLLLEAPRSGFGAITEIDNAMDETAK